MFDFSFLGLVLLGLLAVYVAWSFIYNLYFHPLSQYPGPFLAKISQLYCIWGLHRGRLPCLVHQLHLKYGPIVRLAPNELAFTSPDAWKDIYGHRQGHPQFQKDPIHVGSTDAINGSVTLTMADDETHTRQRRTLAHAFSQKALLEQETVIREYVDLFMAKLAPFAATGQTVNIGDWFNFTTFDIIGDMAFGEPFGCLRDGTFQAWVALLSETLKAGAMEQVTRRLFCVGSLMQRAVMWLIPGDLRRKRREHVELSREKCLERIEQGLRREHYDFLYYILRANEKGNIRRDEIIVNSALFIVAGSETTAALLTSLCMFIMRSPFIYSRLTNEIRSRFPTSAEMTFADLMQLPYLNACINEGLRFFPPAPSGFTRTVPPGGDTVAGHALPGGTTVSVHGFAATHSPDNFANPDEFVPERWIDGDEVYTDDRPDASQPFSLGPRGCLGKHLAYLEMRLILATLLWHYDLERVNGDGSVDLWDVRGDMRNIKVFTTWNKPPLWVKLTAVRR